MRTTSGEKLIAFAERFGRLTKGSEAGKPIVLRDWQKQLFTDLAESGARRAYIQMPRKNGKSMMGALLALHGLCADGEAGAEIYSVAGSREQAKIVFNEARRMVELGPLHKALKLYHNEIVHKASGSRYKALAAEAGVQEGLNPHLVIFDELHVFGSDDRLWNVMNLGSGTREAPLVLAITTPGVRYGSDGRDSVAYTMHQYAKRIKSGEIEDPHFFSRIWETPQESDPYDESVWHLANPALGDFLQVDSMRADARVTPENEFKTKRLGMWVESQTAWLPLGAWEKCEVQPAPPDGTQIILGFDGSLSRDATALVGATVEPNPQVFVVEVWERPLMAHREWKVPREEVTQTVLEACKRWQVRELVSDPSYWQAELQDWSSQKVPVVEFPQTPSRMVPATKRFYEAVLTESMRHDSNPVLARHLGGAILKPNGMIYKEHKDSAKKIDAAVAAVMAYDRASVLGNVPDKPAKFVLWA